MIFMILCHDKPDSLDLRMANRAAHLEYANSAGDRLKLAGPILGEGDNPTPIGSLILLDAASETAAQLFAKNDPYATAGLFDKVQIRPWNPVLGDWKPE